MCVLGERSLFLFKVHLNIFWKAKLQDFEASDRAEEMIMLNWFYLPCRATRFYGHSSGITSHYTIPCDSATTTSNLSNAVVNSLSLSRTDPRRWSATSHFTILSRLISRRQKKIIIKCEACFNKTAFIKCLPLRTSANGLPSLMDQSLSFD